MGNFVWDKLLCTYVHRTKVLNRFLKIQVQWHHLELPFCLGKLLKHLRTIIALRENVYTFFVPPLFIYNSMTTSGTTLHRRAGMLVVSFRGKK